MNQNLAPGSAARMVPVLSALLLCAALIPASTRVGRSDGAGLVTLALSVCATLWGRRLGAGPHPTLTPKGSRFGPLLRALARGIAPWAVWSLVEAARMNGPLLPVLLLWCSLALFAGLSQDHGRTAWNPHPHGLLASLRYDLRLLAPTLSIAVACVLALLLLDRMAVNLHLMQTLWGLPAMVSVQVLLVCALSGRIGNLRQRAAMGMAEEHLPAVVWAAIGPGLTLLGLGILMAAQEHGAEQGSGVPTLMPWHRPALVLAAVLWAWGLWRPRLPSAVLCSWHEVLPRGSDVAMGQGAVPGFEHPPDGALRLNAWATRDTGRVIYWPVPVRDLSWNPLARLPELRAETRTTPGPHLLGETAFEQEKWNRRAQTTRITVRPIPGRRKALGEHAQAVLIRPNRAQFSRSEDQTRGLRSWNWQDAGMPKRIRVLGEQSVHLLDGDVIILSADGVATAWRLEFGPLLLPGDSANQLVLPLYNAGENA